jgi:hypothetical protein
VLTSLLGLARLAAARSTLKVGEHPLRFGVLAYRLCLFDVLKTVFQNKELL